MISSVVLVKAMPKAADKATISVVIPKTIHETLKKLAKEKDWSVSQTAKNLIVEALGLTEPELESEDKEKQ